MTRLGAVFWFVVVLVAGFTTFKVKYTVQDLEDQLNRVRRHTIAEQQEIRVLNAEWTYLTQPERLADLNRRFLGLAPIAPKQLQRAIADIPLRPLPARAFPPDELINVAAAAGPSSAASPIPIDPLPAGMAASPPSAAATAAAPAVLTPAPAQVQLAKTGPDSAPRSLDELIAQTALPVTAAALAPATSQPRARVQLIKTRPHTTSRSLDALISQIADMQ